VREWEDVDDVRVLSVDEILGRVDESSVDVLYNDQPSFTGRITGRSLPHDHRLIGTPAYSDVQSSQVKSINNQSINQSIDQSIDRSPELAIGLSSLSQVIIWRQNTTELN